MTTITATITGLSATGATLSAANRALTTTPALLERIAAMLHHTTLSRFDSQRSPDNTPWQPRASRPAPNFHHPLLNKTGALRASIAVLTHHANAFSLQAKAPYSAFHQFGTPNLPARPFLGVSASDTTAIDQLIARHFQTTLPVAPP